MGLRRQGIWFSCPSSWHSMPSRVKRWGGRAQLMHARFEVLLRVFKGKAEHYKFIGMVRWECCRLRRKLIGWALHHLARQSQYCVASTQGNVSGGSGTLRTIGINWRRDGHPVRGLWQILALKPFLMCVVCGKVRSLIVLTSQFRYCNPSAVSTGTSIPRKRSRNKRKAAGSPWPNCEKGKQAGGDLGEVRPHATLQQMSTIIVAAATAIGGREQHQFRPSSSWRLAAQVKESQCFQPSAQSSSPWVVRRIMRVSMLISRYSLPRLLREMKEGSNQFRLSHFKKAWGRRVMCCSHQSKPAPLGKRSSKPLPILRNRNLRTLQRVQWTCGQGCRRAKARATSKRKSPKTNPQKRSPTYSLLSRHRSKSIVSAGIWILFVTVFTIVSVNFQFFILSCKCQSRGGTSFTASFLDGNPCMGRLVTV